MSIDDFPTIDAPLKQKLKNITANGSLSISLKTIENSKIIESLDNLSSKTSAKSSLSIKLEPKIKHELPSPTISPKIKSNSSELPEIKPPVVPKCFSLMKKSNVIDSNLDHNTFHNSQHTIIGNKPSKAFKEKDYGYIFKISKTIKLPSSLWKSIHRAARNETIFYQTDGVKTFVKRVHFYNSLVPIITIYNMKYTFNVPIKSEIELKILLELTNSIEKSFVMEKNSIGYFEKSYLKLRNQMKMIKNINIPTHK